jgi:hypothetical protein
MLKFRILTTTSLICIAAFLVSSSLLWAKPKAPKPGSDQAICEGKETNYIDDCLKAGHSVAYCGKNGQQVYDLCMLSRGHPTATRGGDYPSPTPPPNVRYPTPVGNNPGPGSSPGRTKPIHPISGPVTTKGPGPSPSPTAQTIYAKPKSTPTPHRDHHH